MKKSFVCLLLLVSCAAHGQVIVKGTAPRSDTSSRWATRLKFPPLYASDVVSGVTSLPVHTIAVPIKPDFEMPPGYSYAISDVTGKGVGQWSWDNPSFYSPPIIYSSTGDTLYLERRVVRGFRRVSYHRDGIQKDTLINVQSRYVKRK